MTILSERVSWCLRMLNTTTRMLCASLITSTCNVDKH